MINVPRVVHSFLPLFFPDHESVATVCADLGSCYYNSGKYELAISRFADCLRIILLRSNTDRSLEVAETLYKIASCHDRLCNYDKGKNNNHIVDPRQHGIKLTN